MSSPTDQVPHPRPPTDFSRSASKHSHISSELREYVSRRRYWLAAGAVILLLVMCLGIVYVAHHYYVTFGGQGFLKARKQDAASRAETADAPVVYLPLRRVATFNMDSGFGWSSRSPMEVPYYACGDQETSCEAYGQPVRPLNLHPILGSRVNREVEYLLPCQNDLSLNTLHQIDHILLQFKRDRCRL